MRCFGLCVLLSCVMILTAWGQSLPVPTGAFAVGRVTLHLTDNARIDPLSGNGGHRELMVDVWYPASSSSGKAAPYVDLSGFEQVLGTRGIQNLLGNAYDAIRRGRAQSNAIEEGPFASSLRRCPLLFFSHGMGMVTQLYSAQLADLASHGYVVAALTHTYDAALTEFPDGRRVKFDTASRPASGSPEEVSIAYERQRLDWWAGDISFVLNELRHTRFADHIDFGRVGAFGHSAGGEAAARACQLDRRVKACLDQDGEARFAPFHRDAAGWGMNQAFLFIERAPITNAITQNDADELHMTLPALRELVASLKAEQDATLGSTGKGSYRIRLRRDVTTHMSFSDLPVLESVNEGESEIRTRVLRLITDYTRSFFDKYLKGAKAPLLDDPHEGEFVDSTKRFPPARPRSGQ